MDEIDTRIVSCLKKRGPLTTGMLSHHTGLPYNDVRDHMAPLRRSGAIFITGHKGGMSLDASDKNHGARQPIWGAVP